MNSDRQRDARRRRSGRTVLLLVCFCVLAAWWSTLSKISRGSRFSGSETVETASPAVGKIKNTESEALDRTRLERTSLEAADRILVEVFVRDERSGEPLAMASIDMRDRNGNPMCQEWSDALGQVSCRLKPGDYRISVACEGCGSYSRTVSIPARTDAPRLRLDIALSSLSMLGGAVTDTTGRRLPGAKVLAWRAGAGDSVERSTSTDSQGRFLFGDLPDGKYRIFAQHSECGEAQSELTELESSGASVFMRLTVGKPHVQVRGIVRDETGKPVAGAEVAVLYYEESGQQKPFLGKSVRVGARGEFVIADLTSGSADVIVQHPEFETSWQSVELAFPVHSFDFNLYQSRRRQNTR